MADFLGTWGWLAAIVTNLFIAWVGWSLRHQFVTRDDHAQALQAMTKHHEDQVASVAERAQKAAEAADHAARRADQVAAELATMPSRDEVHKLHLSVTELSGRIERFGERLDGSRESMSRFQRVLDRVEDFLLKNGGRPA
ncbi:hypothetical protein [Rhodospirillum centenum]|jgi:phage shock protein A|uniref:E or D n=1 Tax=Rhodospirillum centenum (strain ATCC 51521 / SW) TaxID=414684 RepID=B6IME6_RHOCS|nr:hypothetical protein [Rhodospirillum centenum]ACI98525.1 E or D [Rhodospirillum centenum SW]